MRRAAAAMVTSVAPDRWTQWGSVLPKALRLPQFGDKLHKLADLLGAEDADTLYLQLVSHWDPAIIMPDTPEARGVLWDTTVRKDFPELLERMQFFDLVTYLPDDILTKVDRASMAIALEVRIPLLDHRIVEFAWRLPIDAKIRNDQSKWLLRKILNKHVPEHLVERPKMGFGIPLGDWLRGPLRAWVEELLNEQRLRDAELLDSAAVRRRWNEHLEGRRNWQYLLWNVLMLETWRERWM